MILGLRFKSKHAHSSDCQQCLISPSLSYAGCRLKLYGKVSFGGGLSTCLSWRQANQLQAFSKGHLQAEDCCILLSLCYSQLEA